MPHLFEDWPRISQRFHEADRVLLLFDYDGTLTPIVSRPDLALLSTEVRQQLARLSGNRRYVIGIISGRSLPDLRDKVSLPDIIYAGNHGLEIEGPDIHFLHPAAVELKPVLGQVYQDLRHRMDNYPGVIVEDKGLTLSVHVRMVPPKAQEQVKSTFNQVVSPFQGLAQVKVTYGKKVLEVRPNVEWHKGLAIARLIGEHPECSLATFFGDDVTDEDGFAAVQDKHGLAVFVGPPGHATRATYRVDSPREVTEFLHRINQL